MRIGRFDVQIKVLPDSVFHSAQADRLQAMLTGDEVINNRIKELAERAMQPRQTEATA